MHDNAFGRVTDFRNRYLSREERLWVLDVGSYDVNGTYRPIFDAPGWRYIGLDIVSGPNVDIVASPYDWQPIADGSFDVVISGSAFEHIEFFWLTASEIARVVKPGGLVCLNAPSATGNIHRHPVDCWRFQSDGFAAIAKWAKLDVLEIHQDKNKPWHDLTLIARKPAKAE